MAKPRTTPTPPTDTPKETARNRHALRVSATGHRVDRIETLPEEVPVAMVVNGISHAVMLATPADLADFALGFCFTEGIIESASELYDCEVVEQATGLELRLDIASQRFQQFKQRRRSLAGRTGCGLCGVDSLDQACPAPQAVPDTLRIPLATLNHALLALRDHQPLHRRTHAVHAAAWADQNGRILLAREDVGRHNALDKVIGALLKQGTSPASGFCLVTSRASVEMVQKTARAGIELLFSLSAPTGLAVDTADQAGLTLAGSVFDDGFSLHTHPHRILLP